MATVKCPKWSCRSTNVQVISAKTRTSLNLNPLRPFTILNHKQGPTKFMCMDCGNVFEMKV